MSQRSEKLHRQVAQLRADVVELKEHQLTMERFNAALQSVTDEDRTQQILAERRKTRAAQASARAWKLNTILTLILAALAAGVALVISAKAAATEGPAASPTEAPTISDDGRLPGDDTPAQEPVQLDQAHVLESVVITHYDVCERCCGKVDGITASGVHATPYSTVAVDPSVIPLGADVLVDYGDGAGLRRYRAEDTGGAVKGNHIDLCVGSHAEALQLGRRTATIYWVAWGDAL